MRVAALAQEAWHALALNRLRTGLTMLGIVVGVAAVVLMLAVGEGAKDAVRQSIASMGTHLFIVLSGSSSSGAVRFGAGTTPTLTLADAEAIGRLPSVRAVAPVYTGSAQLAYGGLNWSGPVYGVTPEFLEVREWGVESGQALTAADVRSQSRNALIGQTVSQNLFGGEDPVGKTMRIKNLPFLVAGVLEPKGQSLDGRDQDDMVLVPMSTAQTKLFGNVFRGTVRFIMVQARAGEAMDDAEADMTQLLRTRHRLGERDDNDFTVRNLASVAELAATAARVLSVMLGTVASIALVVGGIGIMNIMLVSVTERTREIGVRLAVGARQRDILLQFLLEAVLVCCVGGVLGALLGVGAALLVADGLGMPVVVSGSAIGLAFGFAAATGMLFGYYPARRAALLQPVEALRYE